MSDASDTLIRDVDVAGFEEAVIARSHRVPVVVDLWASWCGPCRTLGPMLEDAIRRRDGAVELAKVDVDANQQLAARFGVRGIPAVKAFRDGEVVAEFVGAQPASAIEAFLDELVPSEADLLFARAEEDGADAEGLLRRVLELDPGHRDAAIALADRIADGDPGEALELIAPHRPDPQAERVAARLAVASGGGDVETLRAAAAEGDLQAQLRLGRALAARGEYEAAVDELLEVVRSAGDESDEARRQILDVLTVAEDPAFVAAARRRLAGALY